MMRNYRATLCNIKSPDNVSLLERGVQRKLRRGVGDSVVDRVDKFLLRAKSPEILFSRLKGWWKGRREESHRLSRVLPLASILILEWCEKLITIKRSFCADHRSSSSIRRRTIYFTYILLARERTARVIVIREYNW